MTRDTVDGFNTSAGGNIFYCYHFYLPWFSLLFPFVSVLYIRNGNLTVILFFLLVSCFKQKYIINQKKMQTVAFCGYYKKSLWNSLFEIDQWTVKSIGFDNQKNEIVESVMSLGNGHMGLRGNFEETFSGETLKGTYIAGIYYPDKYQSFMVEKRISRIFRQSFKRVRLYFC